MLCVPEAAAILGVGPRTLYRLVEERKVPHVKLGGAIRFERGVLVEWIRSQMLQGAQHVGTPAGKPVDVRLRDLEREGGARSAAGSRWVRTERQAEQAETRLRAEAVRRMEDAARTDRPGALPKAAFSGFANHWMGVHVETNCKPSVVRRYESIIRIHLLPHFGDLEITAIDRHGIEKFKAANVKVISTETGKPLSKKTVNEHIAVLASMFERAVEWGYLRANPCRGVRRFKLPTPAFRFYTKEQSDAFLEAAARVEQAWYTLFLVGFRTGLRLGELIALEWGDVDLVTGTINVRRSRTRNVTTAPKSNLERIVDLSPAVVAALREHRHLRGDLVFPQPDGSHLTRDVLKHPFGRLIRAATLPIIRIHDLRHSFASQLVMRGVPLKAVQELLGHVDIKMTMRYAHLAPDAKKNYVRVLDDVPQLEPVTHLPERRAR